MTVTIPDIPDQYRNIDLTAKVNIKTALVISDVF